MDSYDKLTPFGIRVNGCIDGFSRHIIWMEANCTNSNPCVIAAYFAQTVTKLGGCPKILRSDHGTENVHANRLFSGKMTLERSMVLLVFFKEEAWQTRESNVGGGCIEDRMWTTGETSSESSKLPVISVVILSTRVSFNSVS